MLSVWNDGALSFSVIISMLALSYSHQVQSVLRHLLYLATYLLSHGYNTSLKKNPKQNIKRIEIMFWNLLMIEKKQAIMTKGIVWHHESCLQRGAFITQNTSCALSRNDQEESIVNTSKVFWHRRSRSPLGGRSEPVIFRCRPCVPPALITRDSLCSTENVNH